GLRPCAFVMLTGRLCPTCGMTTAFAWFARGQLGHAWEASPAGCLLAITSVPLAVWLLLCAVRAEPVGFQSLQGPLVRLLLGSLVLSGAFWLVRLVLSPAVVVRRGTASAPSSRTTGM